MSDSKTEPLDKEMIASLVGEQILQAQGYDGDYLAQNRTDALRYYFAETETGGDASLAKAITGTDTVGPVNTGRERVRSMDVANLVDAVQAFLAPMLNHASVEFVPNSANDEIQAQMESDAVVDVLKRNNAWSTFSQGFFNALLQRTGWIQVQVVEMEEVKRERHTGLEELEAAMIRQPTSKNQTVEVTKWEDGDLNITRTTVNRELEAEAVAPENMLYQPGFDSTDIQGIDFIARRRMYTRSELLALGYSKDDVERCQTFQPPDYWGEQARQGSAWFETHEAAQWASQLVEVHDCYVMLDMKGNGKAERYKVCISGKVVLGYELHPYVPFAHGSAIPIPNRVEGKSLYDVGKTIQDAKTTALRNYLDNQKALTTSRVGAVKGAVELDDLLNGRVNGVVRITRPDALVPLPANDIGPSAIQFLQTMDQERTSRGGSALDMANADYQIASSSTAAAVGELNNKEMMASWYGKNLANTLLKEAFLLTHLVLRHSWPEPLMVKQAGQWIEVQPSNWGPRYHAKVITGLSTAEKNAKSQSLQAIFGLQSQLMQAVPGITDTQRVYNTLVDFVKMVDTGEPESYFMNPQSPESQQAQQQAQQAQLQQMQQQEQQMQMQAQFQMQLQTMQEETKRMGDQMKTQFDYFNAILTNDAKEAELTISALEQARQATENEQSTESETT